MLKAYDGYWGDKAKIETVIFKPIADGPARKQALQAGEIQGYDLVDPADLDALKSEGFQLLERPAFNVGYVGFNTAKPPLDNPKIRQADRLRAQPPGPRHGEVPAGLRGREGVHAAGAVRLLRDRSRTYPYDVEKAKALIAESGVANPTLEFWYPTNVSRPYMPDPAANFQAFKADLEAAGFTVETKSRRRGTRTTSTPVNTGKAGLYLLGWTGDFGDPDNFVGTFFRTKQPAWGPLDQSIYTDLEAARDRSPTWPSARRSTRPRTRRSWTSCRASRTCTPPRRWRSPRTSTGYVPSPVSIEDFSKVSLG